MCLYVSRQLGLEAERGIAVVANKLRGISFAQVRPPGLRLHKVLIAFVAGVLHVGMLLGEVCGKVPSMAGNFRAEGADVGLKGR